MRQNILFFIFFLAGYCAVAQSDYLISTKSPDTIRGELRILSYDKLDRVQVSNKGKKEVYSALQVLTLKIHDDFYKAIQIDNTVQLVKVLKSGYLSLYGYKMPNQTTYDGLYLLKLDGSSLDMPNLGFKKLMASFLEDCEEISKKLKKGELKKEDMSEIVDSYNICVAHMKPATPTDASTAQVEAIQNLSNKITELNFDSKDDALDILRDMKSKVEKNEKISKYLTEGLETALKDQSTLSEDLNKLITLLKK